MMAPFYISAIDRLSLPRETGVQKPALIFEKLLLYVLCDFFGQAVIGAF